MKYLFLLIVVCLNLLAHQSSLAFLNLKIEDRLLKGTYKVSLEDVQKVYNFDTDFNSKIQWKELLKNENNFKKILMEKLYFTNNKNKCKIHFKGIQLESLTFDKYLYLDFDAKCHKKIESLNIHYLFLFNQDLQHKMYMNIKNTNSQEQFIFTRDTRFKTIQLIENSNIKTFLKFLKEGIIHIIIGYDHILFLISLLITSVLYFKDNKYHPRDSIKRTFVNILFIITTFTIAHSITLILSILGFISLPIYIVELAIAFSVILAAINNIKPFISKKLWVFIFIFGLIHGIGFSSVLTDLSLNDEAKTLSLLSFNLGVELGQLFIVLLITPILYIFRSSKYYEFYIVKILSLIIILIGIYWIYERL
jgi:hydrogenase/urease accessory protein HupE